MAVIGDKTTDAKDDRSRYRRFREHPYVVRLLGLVGEVLPKGLYARALLIIITPIVVLEGVIAFAFMERHWQAVTRRLSEATARDIAALIEIYGDLPKTEKVQKIIDLARDRLNLTMEVLPPGNLPPPGPKPFFRLLDRALSNELTKARTAAVLDRHGRGIPKRRDPGEGR